MSLYVVAFDGFMTYETTGNGAPGDLIAENCKWVLETIKSGHTVIIVSWRSSGTVAAHLEKHGWPYSAALDSGRFDVRMTLPIGNPALYIFPGGHDCEKQPLPLVSPII